MGDAADSALAGWLRSAGHVYRWEAGVPIVRQGESDDGVVLIRTGSVKVVSGTPGGRQVLLAMRGAGDVVGEFAALDGRPRSANVLTLTEVEGWKVSSVAFLDHLAVTPGTSLALLRLLVRRLREADLRRLEFGSLGTTSRVAAVLGAADLEHGPGGWIPLTQGDVSEAVGASREATVKALARLRRAGLVETARGRVRVLQPDVVAQVAEDSEVIPPYRSSQSDGRDARGSGRHIGNEDHCG